MSHCTPCKSMRPSLFRVAEGEATPEEAIAEARHLSECTACRIVLARERRLAQMLEQDLEDPLAVGEDFVHNVMANLPTGTPRHPDRNAAGGSGRRKNKLAVLFGGLGSLAV